MGFSTQYAQSHPFWCRPNKNTSYFSRTGEEKNEVLDHISFDGSRMFSCHVVALCTTVLHTVCVYLCVLFGMSCYGMYMYIRVSDRQTNKHSVKGGQETRNFFTHFVELNPVSVVLVVCWSKALKCRWKNNAQQSGLLSTVAQLKCSSSCVDMIPWKFVCEILDATAA